MKKLLQSFYAKLLLSTIIAWGVYFVIEYFIPALNYIKDIVKIIAFITIMVLVTSIVIDFKEFIKKIKQNIIDTIFKDKNL